MSVEPLDVGVTYRDFDDFWEPFTAGVGPTGAYCVSLDPAAQSALREECRQRLGSPESAFELPGRSWACAAVRPDDMVRARPITERAACSPGR